MSIAVGDIIAVGQLAFALYRQCYLVARGAPQDFQSLLADLTTLSSSIQLLQDEVKNENSVLVRSGEDRLRMMQVMIKRVEATLLELDKFATKYAKLLDASRSKTRKVWDRIKWSSELADIDDLRNKLVYHNGVIHLLLTAAGNSSLERIETSTLKLERRLTSIRELITKSQATHEQPTLSGRAVNSETNLLIFELSAILMKHAEAFTPWKAIGIREWINAGRWWLLKYQLEEPIEPGEYSSISSTIYACLIKASWVLSDVISKHPQLSLLEAAVQYDVQALAEAIDEEFKKIDSQKLRTPRLADLDSAELYIWEAQKINAQNISPSTVGGVSSAVIHNTGAFDLVLQRFGFYEHTTGLRVPCCVQLFVHRHDKLIRLQIYNQNWKVHTEADVDPNTRSTIYCTDEAISIDGLRVILGTRKAILLHVLLSALVEYVWWYRSKSEPEWIGSFYTKLFGIIFAAGFGHMQFVENPADMNHLFRPGPYWSNSGADEFRLVEDTRITLQEYVVLDHWGSRQLKWTSRMQEQMNRKDETVLPWMAVIRDFDWNAIQLWYTQICPVGQDPARGRNPKEHELRERTMKCWTYYTDLPESLPFSLFDYGIGCVLLAYGNGNKEVAQRTFLELIKDDTMGKGGWSRAKVNSKRELESKLYSSLLSALSTGETEMVEMLVDSESVQVTGDGYEAMVTAVEIGHRAVVRLLIENGASVNAPTYYMGRTALQAAMDTRHEAIVKLLIDNGVDVGVAPTAWDFGTGTKPQADSRVGVYEDAVLKLLVGQGANVNALGIDSLGKTPLQAASEGGNETIVGLLLEKGADVNAQPGSDNGSTALQAASGGGHETIVRLLLEKGADVNAPASSSNGRTALQAASEAGHETIVRLLLEKGAGVNVPAGHYHGRTALQAASEAGQETIVRLLLEKGADVNAEAGYNNGKTALQAASEGGHKTIAKLLKDHGARG